MKNLCIITARGGSKRIPHKNIKSFMGKPMLAYAIEAARGSNIFSEIMVSTEDVVIAKVARTYGANVPFMRSKETAHDHATTMEVLCEVIQAYKLNGKIFDALCCIYPCVPFLNAEILREAYMKFQASGSDALIPVVKYSFPIQRAFKINKNGYLEYREIENSKQRTQDLEPMYHDVGMFYFYKPDKLQGHAVPFEMEERFVQDIDTMEDWAMAELKYKIMNHA